MIGGALFPSIDPRATNAGPPRDWAGRALCNVECDVHARSGEGGGRISTRVWLQLKERLPELQCQFVALRG